MKYREDGEVDWGNMWDTFCLLALEGGPRHPQSMLEPQEDSDPDSPAYHFAAQEIIRGIHEVSQLHARFDKPGWLAIPTESAAYAKWIAEAMCE